MHPYHYNAGSQGQSNEIPYDQRGMSQYQQQVYQSGDDMRARLAHAQQTMQRLNEDKQKQQFHHQQYQQQHQVSAYQQQVQQTLQKSPAVVEEDRRRRRDSRSPSWAREARKSRSRSRERGGDRRRRSRSRSREDRYRRNSSRRDRSRSRSPTSRASRSRGGRRRSMSMSPDRNADKMDWGIPCNKLALLNMPNDVDNAKITFAFGKCGYLPQDVRTNTKYDNKTKLIKTFAFVEFSDTPTAQSFMQENKGILTLEDGRRVMAEYARGDPALGHGSGHEGDDWICAHCSMNNFVKRKSCFKCDISKEQSMELEKQGVHMVGVTPCDTLLIRGLPEGCTNTTVFDSLVSLVCLNSISMIKLSESKRFAYLQMKSTDEAVMLLNLTYKSTLKIKNKDVQVSYCRDSMSRLIQQQMQMLTQGAVPEQQGPFQGNLTGPEIAAAALAKAHAVRQASNQCQQMMSTSMPPPGMMPPPNFSVPPPNMGGPPIMTQAPPMQQQPQPQQQQEQPKNGIIGITPTPRGVFPRYVPPNPMHFLPDANSGYYLDPITNFFYDQKTGYYYNNEAKKWCTWDATYQTYFAVEESQNAAEQQQQQQQSAVQPIPQPVAAAALQDIDDEEDVSEIEVPKKDDGPKTAAEMAKDMAKWAKKQEKDKKKVQLSLKVAPKGIETMRNVFQSEKKKTSAPSSSSALDFADDDEEDPDQAGNIDPHTGKVRGTGTGSGHAEEIIIGGAGGSRRGTSAMEMREAMERALVDEAKKMCLLCKRAFPSVDVLRKHVEKSDLHRTNLEKKRIEWGKELADTVEEEEKNAKEIEMPKIVYRDRAKERRKQFGYNFDVNSGNMSGNPGRNEEMMRRDSEHAASRPLDDNNIGNRLLKNMGWKEGQGVGKHGQGITAPIQAERFVQGAGLGSSGSKIRGGVESSHKEKTRQALFSRYNDQ